MCISRISPTNAYAHTYNEVFSIHDWVLLGFSNLRRVVCTPEWLHGLVDKLVTQLPLHGRKKMRMQWWYNAPVLTLWCYQTWLENLMKSPNKNVLLQLGESSKNENIPLTCDSQRVSIKWPPVYQTCAWNIASLNIFAQSHCSFHHPFTCWKEGVTFKLSPATPRQQILPSLQLLDHPHGQLPV